MDGQCRGCGAWLADGVPRCPYCAAPVRRTPPRTGAGPAVPPPIRAPEILTPAQIALLHDRVRAALGAESDLYLGEDIPKKKRTNARARCGVPPEEQVVVLVDGTVFGSADNALLLTGRAVYAHNDWSGLAPGAWRVPWSELVTVDLTCPSRTETRLGEQAYFNSSGSGLDAEEVQRLLIVLKEVLSEDSAPPGLAPAPAVAADGPAPAPALPVDLGDGPLGPRLIAAVRDQLGEPDDLYTGDDIPTSKLANARRSCQVPPKEEIAILVDATIFGSAENALLVGKMGVYLRNDWTGKTPGAFAVPWAELLAVELAAPPGSEARVGDAAWFDTAGCRLSPTQVKTLLEAVRGVVRRG